jgi:hypothetical protein
VAVRSKGSVWGRSLASNPAGGMAVCLLWIFVLSRQRCLRWADHSSRGVLQNTWCVSVWSWSLDTEEALAHWGLLRHTEKKKRSINHEATYYALFCLLVPLPLRYKHSPHPPFLDAFNLCSSLRVTGTTFTPTYNMQTYISVCFAFQDSKAKQDLPGFQNL